MTKEAPKKGGPYSKPRREWASVSAPGIVVQWDDQNPLFERSRETIERLIRNRWVL